MDIELEFFKKKQIEKGNKIIRKLLDDYKEGDIIIPEGVKYIGADSFYTDKNIEGTLIFPKSIREVNISAIQVGANSHVKLKFKEPSNLKYLRYRPTIRILDWLKGDLKLPEGLEEIEDYCFNKSFIKSLEIPSTIKKIGSYAFGKCPYLEEVTFKGTNCNELSDIDDYIFEGDTSLKTIKTTPSLIKYFYIDGTDTDPYILDKYIVYKDDDVKVLNNSEVNRLYRLWTKELILKGDLKSMLEKNLKFTLDKSIDLIINYGKFYTDNIETYNYLKKYNSDIELKVSKEETAKFIENIIDKCSIEDELINSCEEPVDWMTDTEAEICNILGYTYRTSLASNSWRKDKHFSEHFKSKIYKNLEKPNLDKEIDLTISDADNKLIPIHTTLRNYYKAQNILDYSINQIKDKNIRNKVKIYLLLQEESRGFIENCLYPNSTYSPVYYKLYSDKECKLYNILNSKYLKGKSLYETSPIIKNKKKYIESIMNSNLYNVKIKFNMEMYDGSIIELEENLKDLLLVKDVLTENNKKELDNIKTKIDRKATKENLKELRNDLTLLELLLGKDGMIDDDIQEHFNRHK